MLATDRNALLAAPLASFVRSSPRAGATCAAAILFINILLAGPLAAQDQPPKPVEDIVAVAAQDALTKTIADRVRQSWGAWKKGDAAAFDALTTDDYREVAATGTLHFYRFTSQELAALPISQFTISQLQALPIGQDGALVTYVGLITFQNGGPLKFAFGEVWVREGDEWKCKYSQATTMFVP
ncbi:MAG: nuclear transport factor 2 family protein [Terracidiphilus sp.]